MSSCSSLTSNICPPSVCSAAIPSGLPQAPVWCEAGHPEQQPQPRDRQHHPPPQDCPHHRGPGELSLLPSLLHFCRHWSYSIKLYLMDFSLCKSWCQQVLFMLLVTNRPLWEAMQILLAWVRVNPSGTTGSRELWEEEGGRPSSRNSITHRIRHTLPSKVFARSNCNYTVLRWQN